MNNFLRLFIATTFATVPLAIATVAGAGWSRYTVAKCVNDANGGGSYGSGFWSGSSARIDCALDDTDLTPKSSTTQVDVHLLHQAQGTSAVQLCVRRYAGAGSAPGATACDGPVNSSQLPFTGAKTISILPNSSSVWKQSGSIYDYPYISTSLAQSAKLNGVLVYQ